MHAQVAALAVVLLAGAQFALAARPNILFAIADDQSYPHAGAYGCAWVQTPAFDRIAESGLLFRNCYTPNAKCAPSRSSIVTGRNSWQLEAAGNHVCYYPDKFASYCEVLTKKTDYFIGFTGKGVAPVKTSEGRLLLGAEWSSAVVEEKIPHVSDNDYAANFEQFLDAKPADRPFCFWYGAVEPHRPYGYGLGVERAGKSVGQIDSPPAYWPENETIRTDMLDYAFEIEHFDAHLQRMLALLEQRGELDNTLVVVTSDNGMPFPRCKGTQYERSNHMPLAIMWPLGIRNPGREIADFVSFIDFAPTLLEAAGVTVAEAQAAGMQPIQGASLFPIFRSDKTGQVIAQRDHVLLGQERHDVGRPDDVGYPIRSIIQDGMLYIHNFEPDRWPMCNPETGYLNTDGSPTKTVVLNMRRTGENDKHWRLCFGKRGREELYDIRKDPDCVKNLIAEPDRAAVAQKLKAKLFAELKAQGDPRMSDAGRVFDEYRYADEATRDFYNRHQRGEIDFTPGWVNETDFEKAPIDE